MTMKDVNPTAPKGKGLPIPVRHSTSQGQTIRGYGQRGDGRKSSGMTDEARRGLGIGKRK